jgi:hypothetical protein
MFERRMLGIMDLWDIDPNMCPTGLLSDKCTSADE